MITNKKATHDYHILERWEAGVVLKGSEVKSIREGKVNFIDSFVRVISGELFLHNLHIAPYARTSQLNLDPKRPRKLLLHHGEIRKLIGTLSQKGLTLIPLSIYFKKGKVKVGIGLAKGKRLYDKRKKLREISIEREIKRTLKERKRYYPH
jgi:SsrA-binding protein